VPKDEVESMTERRQAPHAGSSAATLFFLTLILISFFSAQSVLAQSVSAQSAVLLTLISAITLVYWHCYRRDDTSPRRVGRRI
jgi:hypothetical protein